MEITRRDIANYKLLGILLEKDKKKLERYIEKRPSCCSGKVYGSNPQFPYEARGFTITGCTEYEQQQMKKWEEDCRIIEEQIQSDIRYLNELELAIDNVIANCKDIEDKAILEYTKDGVVSTGDCRNNVYGAFYCIKEVVKICFPIRFHTIHN